MFLRFFVTGRRFIRMNSSFANEIEEFKELGNRIKALESQYDYQLPSSPKPTPYVIRLDGVAFRTLTQGLKKPFDSRFTKAMLLSTEDLMNKLPGSVDVRLAFVQSDEVTLICAAAIPAIIEKSDGTCQEKLSIPYSGRLSKICSTMAGYLSTRFNAHIQSMGWSDLKESRSAEMFKGVAYFDAS